MTPQDFALLLQGTQYREELTSGQEHLAKERGLVVVFGASDDLIEFRGAIRDEGDCYEGGTFYVDEKGILPDRENIDDDDELKDLFPRKPNAKPIEAIWNRDGYSWVYKTDIPHATFEVMEGSYKYCQGIVFSISDLK